MLTLGETQPVWSSALYIYLTTGKSACWIAGRDDLLKAAAIGGMEVACSEADNTNSVA
jgi:hypothetical protein